MKTISPTTAQLRMLASVKSQTWLIRPEAVQNFAMSALEASEKTEVERSDAYLEQFYNLRQAAFIDADGIAHIQIVGALLFSCPAIYEKLGLATRYETLIAEIEGAEAAGAKAILFHVDSPGGTVAGVIEAGEAIASVGIPTAAHCHGLACSAAYWLTAGTQAVFASPSATVGNIGAIISWADCSKFWEDMGITFKALTSEGADLKSTFHLEPDEAQLAFLQASIDEAGAQFRDHVTAGRTAAGAELDPEVFRAGWYSGETAWNLGLVDSQATAEQARQYLITSLQVETTV